MKKHVPIRLDYYQYCVETWVEIFKQLDFSKIKTVTDLCLGWSPKIELALLKTNFKGKLFALDKSRHNLSIFSALINDFDNQYNIHTYTTDVLKIHNNKKFSGDLVVGNHITDDLLIDCYLLDHNINDEHIFENIHRLEKIWSEISKNQYYFNKVLLNLIPILNVLTRKKGYLIFTQYQSYQEKLYKLDRSYMYCKTLLQNVKEELINTYKFIDRSNTFDFSFQGLTYPYFKEEDILCLQKAS